MTINYQIYSNGGSGGAVDYSTPVATTSALSAVLGPLAPSSDNTFVVRALDTTSGLEEANTTVSVRIVIGADGSDVTALPASPHAVALAAVGAGSCRVSWAYVPVAGYGTPTGFNVYLAPSSAAAPVPPTATVAYQSGCVGYSVLLAGPFAAGSYLATVTAYNATGAGVGASLSGRFPALPRRSSRSTGWRFNCFDLEGNVQAMTLAIGGSSSAGNSTVGQLWVNVLDYGARADNGVTDNSGPIQAAIDALAAMMAGVNVASGIVYIPSATESYCVTKPIYLDSSNIEIRGDGAGSVVYMIGGAHPVFIVGVSRVATSYVNGVATPVSIGTANRPDCFGVLDKTAAAAAGTVWGLRTYNNTFVQFQGSAISAGAAVAGATSFSDNWGTTNQLTIEFCIEPPAGTQFQPYTPILGMGSLGQTGPVQASPFMVSTGYEANMIQMMFRTAEMQPLSVRVFDFLLGTATPPYRVAIQIDLVNAVYSAYVNGVQVAFNDVPPAFSPNLVFATNDFFPFMIGSFGPTATYTGTTGVDLSVYGLRLSNTLRYQNNGAGTKQTRADAPTTALTDSWAYFGNDAHTIAYLPGTDNPATAGRRVTVAHGGAAGYGPSSGLFINAVAPTYSSGNTFRDLYIQCGTGYGAGILVGTVLELTIEDVKIASGYYGIGSFNSTVNYFVRMARCDLMGTDSAYYSAFQISWARDITFQRVGASDRAPFRQRGELGQRVRGERVADH